MANETQRRLTGIVEFVLKDKGLVDLKARIDSLEKDLGKANAQLKGGSDAAKMFGNSIKGAFGPLMGFLSVGGIAGLLAKNVADLIKFDRQMAAIAATITSFGGNAEKEMPKIQGFFGSLQKATGFVDDEMAPVFRKLVGLTQDVGASLSLLSLSAGAARMAGTDLATAGDLVASVMAGKAGPALKELGINAKTVGVEGQNAEAGLRILFDRIDKFNASNPATGTEQLRAAWDDLGDTISRKLVGPFQSVAKYAAFTIEHIKAIALVAAGQWGEAGRQAAKDAEENDLEERRRFTLELIGRSKALALARERDQKAAAADREKEAKDAEQLAIKVSEGKYKIAHDDLERTRKMETDVLEARQKEVNAYLDAESKATIKAFLDAIDGKRQLSEAEIEDMRARNEETAAYLTGYYAQLTDEYRAYIEKKAELDLAALDVEQAAEEARAKSPEELAAIQQRYATKRMQIEGALHRALLKWDQERTTSQLESAAMVAGALAELFPKFKAFAIAEALINTYVGIANALREVAPWWVVAARVIWTAATGFAQVSRIRAAQAPKMAEGGLITGPRQIIAGEAGPELIVPLTNRKAQAALAQVTSQTGGGGDTFVFNGIYAADEASMRQFARKLSRASRNDRRNIA